MSKDMIWTTYLWCARKIAFYTIVKKPYHMLESNLVLNRIIYTAATSKGSELRLKSQKVFC